MIDDFFAHKLVHVKDLVPGDVYVGYLADKSVCTLISVKQSRIHAAPMCRLLHLVNNELCEHVWWALATVRVLR